MRAHLNKATVRPIVRKGLPLTTPHFDQCSLFIKTLPLLLLTSFSNASLNVSRYGGMVFGEKVPSIPEAFSNFSCVNINCDSIRRLGVAKSVKVRVSFVQESTGSFTTFHYDYTSTICTV